MISLEALRFVEETAIEEEILAKARHDLRNRLAVIRGSAFYLRRRVETTPLWESDARVAQFFAQVEHEVDTATVILAENLALNRPLTRRLEVVDLAECARHAAEKARLGEAGDVRVELDVAGAEARVEPVELCLAVRCLLENAAEAMRGGGVARVIGRLEEKDFSIEVHDEGDGLGAGGAEQAMEPFFTTKPQRRGLGLNIAQRICRRHGGRLEIRSLPRGACARISFPIAGGARADAPLGG